MQGITGMFNIGRLALFANQKALAVTSHNIANANTPGYSRQNAVLSETRPIDGRPGQIGTGVSVTQIRRIVDRFIENQITAGGSNLGRLQTTTQYLRRIESTFTDSQGTGINKALSNLFAAIQDLSTNPQSQPERNMLLEQAKALSQVISTTDAHFQQVLEDTNNAVLGTLNDINASAAQIADLNAQIRNVEITGQGANDLRDQRQLLLNDLSGKININTFENDLGEITIFVGGGHALVEGSHVANLRGIAGTDNSGFVKISFDPGTGTTSDITSAITNGRLKGLLDVRDTTLPDIINQLDKLAAGIINTINQQHRSGFGLDASTGNDFFSPLTPSVSEMSTNTGSAVVSATIASPANLTFNRYDLSFSGGTYTFRNIDTGTTATSTSSPITFEGIQLTLSGTPANGDTFQVSAHQGAAGSMAVALTDPDKIAAAGAVSGIPGDNSNALLMAGFQDKNITALGGATFQKFYSNFVGKVGSDTRLAKNSLSVEEVIHEQIGSMREEVSGVSLDEEMSNLIKFQRAYQASAKIITIADELLETVIRMV